MLSKEEHIARLIFLHIQGMTDNVQDKELNEWRSVSPRHEELFQRMLSSEHVEKSISRFVKTEEEEERGWWQLQQRARSGRSVRKIKWFPYAAAIVLILSVGGVFYFSGDKVQAEILPIANEAAFSNANDIAKTEGILVGISSGAALAAAIELAKREENAGKTIVALFPDTGERYLSTGVFNS